MLVLPARPGGPGWTALTKDATPGHTRLWSSLAAISQQLDASHRLPRVRAGSDGTYLVE